MPAGRKGSNSVRSLEAGTRLVGEEGHHALQFAVGQVGSQGLSALLNMLRIQPEPFQF